MLGGALVVPAGLLRKLRGDEPADPVAATFAADAAARKRIEQLAMKAVRRAEEARGCRVVDVSAAKCGWDLTSYPPAVDGKQPEPRHIEVKGRVKGAGTVTVTRNEMLYAFNQGDKFVLAIVLVGEDDAVDGPHYIRNPFEREPGWGVASINYNLSDLLGPRRGPMTMQHPVKSPKKLIEVALPLDAINAAAAREKSIRHGHPTHAASVVGAAAAGGGAGRHLRAAGQRPVWKWELEHPGEIPPNN